MDPIIGSALIGAGANLIGNLFGSSNNKKANDTNIKLAQMNNQFNEAMLQKQMDYNYNIWQQQNAYNNPSAQRARLQAAGFNPYLALGQISSGQAQSVGGVNTPTASPVSVQPFTPDFGGIGDAAQTYVAQRLQEKSIEADNSVKEQQAENLRIENQYTAAKAIEMINNLRLDADGKKLKNYYQQIQNRFAADMFSSDINFKNRQIQSIEADIRSKHILNSINEIHKLNLPKQYELTFSSIAADILLKSASTDKEWAAVYTELEKAFKENAQAYNIRLNNYVLESTLNAMIDEAKATARQAGIAADFEGINQITGLAGNLINGYTQFKGTRPSKKHTYGYNRGKYYDVWEVNY